MCLHVKQQRKPHDQSVFIRFRFLINTYTFTKYINELGKLIYSDSYTKTNSADTCVKSEYQQQLQSGGDPWG